MNLTVGWHMYKKLARSSLSHLRISCPFTHHLSSTMSKDKYVSSRLHLTPTGPPADISINLQGTVGTTSVPNPSAPGSGGHAASDGGEHHHSHGHGHGKPVEGEIAPGTGHAQHHRHEGPHHGHGGEGEKREEGSAKWQE